MILVAFKQYSKDPGTVDDSKHPSKSHIIFNMHFQLIVLHFYSLSFDLKERHTVFSLVIGGIPHWLKSQAVSQNMIQRYLSLPTLASARKYTYIYNY